jgi:MraZ protein
MFIGQFEHNIDDKGRIAIPRKFRDQFAAGLVLTQSFDPCLWVYTMRGWETMTDQFSGLSIFDTDARTALRIIYGSASDCQLDQQGRVVVPSYLREYAKLKNDVIVVGASTVIEIWDRETWEERKRVHQTEGAQIVQRLAAQGKG